MPRCTSVILLSVAATVIGPGATIASGQCSSVELAKLSAPSPVSMDEVGLAVAIDGVTAVVGAPGTEFDEGAAYVYAHDGMDWRLLGALTASDGVGGFGADTFGTSVAIEGETIVVGAPMPSPAERPGATYVFVRPEAGWMDMTETVKLEASDGEPNDNFGHSVAISGDVIVVGAYLDDTTVVNAGSAYVFRKPAGGWPDAGAEDAWLSATTPAESDELGRAVAIDGGTIVLGSHYDSEDDTQAGATFVYAMPRGGWANATETARLASDHPQPFDRMGLSVGVSGDTVIAGAWADDGLGQQAGVVYVFDRPDTGWAPMAPTAELSASDGGAGQHLGWSVAIDGATVIAGAPANLFDGTGAGGLYVFRRPAGGWTDMVESAKVTTSDGADNDEVGIAVAIDGPRAIGGARFHDTAGFAQAGAAYLVGGTADCDDDGTLDLCQIAGGGLHDADGDGAPDDCVPSTPADVNGDGVVDVQDLVAVITAWGACDGDPCPADVDGNGTVDVADLVAVVLAWG